MAKPGKRGSSLTGWSKRVLINLLSHLTWVDFLVGLGLASTISLLLVGFSYQAIPDYKVSEIATQDVRALQDTTYEDVAATEQNRQAARAKVPILYELNASLISEREDSISKAFSEARDLLAEKGLPSRGKLSSTVQAEVLQALGDELGNTIPSALLPMLMRQRFDPVLEGKILKVLDTVLRSGIVGDREQFLEDQQTGITLRDSSSLFERPLPDTFMVRDLAGAREYLNQFHLEFSELPPRNRRDLVQYLGSLLFPTVIRNEMETNVRRDLAAGRVAPVQIRIQQGKTIVRSGEQITPNIVSQLQALKNLQKPRSLIWQWGGYFFFVALFMYALWRYFVYYQVRHRKIRNHMVLILVVIISVLFAMRLSTSLADILGERLSGDTFFDSFNLYYAIPFAFGSILVTLLVDVNFGIILTAMISALCGLFYGDIYLASYVLIGNLTGIYSVRQYKDRAAILKAGLTIGVVNAFGLVAIGLLREMPVASSATLNNLWFAMLSGMLSAALASMLLPLLETFFKITTDIRLLELSNLNATILRRLAVEAPGTYHHSLMVGTLAEAAAEAIDANGLLARVAAYYHDLGKMLRPEYFVENQIFGLNQHETISPRMSAIIIAGHIRDGLDLAREIGLTERVRDMIPQHHGTRVMTYFHQKAKDLAEKEDEEIVESDFRYPGPKPQSKEAAVLMMADSVEAASRTLSNPSAAQIQGMIQRIVDAIVADDQLDQCDITLREIRIVKESFFKIITGIYHQRIDYPGYDFKEIAEAAGRTPLQSSGPRQAKAL